MTRRIITFILIYSTLAASCSRAVIFAGFQFNRAYIAKTLCINRNKPWMHCNGRCYFMRKIQQADENEKKQTAKENIYRLEISFFQKPLRLAFIEPKILETEKNTFSVYSFKYLSWCVECPFKPPRHIV
jgi:hypothetical protein